MNNIKSVIIIILFLGLNSCDADFLDVTPSNSGDASTSIKTLADAKVMLTGIMSNMTSSNYYGRNFILYADAKGGDCCGPERPTLLPHRPFPPNEALRR